jgi:NAD dependent epimerase/dehydratase family enzyme
MAGGHHYMPWISLRDEVAALAFLVDHPEITGPVNLAGPEPAKQREVAAELGRLLRRPAVLPAPGPAIRVVLGEFSTDVLASLRVMPARLLDAGFVHQDTTLTAALEWALDA